MGVKKTFFITASGFIAFMLCARHPSLSDYPNRIYIPNNRRKNPRFFVNIDEFFERAPFALTFPEIFKRSVVGDGDKRFDIWYRAENGGGCAYAPENVRKNNRYRTVRESIEDMAKFCEENLAAWSY